jgi:F0F1-type ATP synthase assembly protein I
MRKKGIRISNEFLSSIVGFVIGFLVSFFVCWKTIIYIIETILEK